MRKNLLLAGLFTTFSLVVKSQVGINTSNPQGVFNIDGLKNNPTTGVPNAVQAKDDLVMISNGNLGLGLTAPGTTLDVNGAITNRETALAVAGNAVTIPVNVSQVQLTGAATATVAISAFAAPNPGQRLIVYNNTTGGFGATLDGVTIPNGKALEFVFSNSFWRSTDGGAAGASLTNIYTADGTLTGNRTVTQGANTLTFTGTQTNAFSVDGTTLSVDAANDRVGVGTTTPTNKLVVTGTNAQPTALGTANTSATLRVDGNTNHAMDFGTYTNSPFGSYISSQNKTAATGLPLVLNPVGGNVGVAIASPGTALDVNGAITNRETALAVAGNAVTIPVNVSQVQLTGTATANVAISAPAAPNAGQRLIVYNNTTGGFGATLDGVTIPNGKALEFVFSNSFWRSTDGGAAGANPVNIYTANGTLAGNRTVTTAGNSLSFTNGSNSVSVGTTGTEGIVRANGASRGSVLATGGGNTLSMYADDNGKAVMMTSGNNTGIDIGAATADPVNILTNNTNRVTVTSAGSVGVATTTPQRALHVNGALQVTNEINVGGNGTTAGSAGTSGQILTSGGAGAAPTWQTLNTVSGTINSAVYVQGTTEATATVGQTIDVPGVTATLTVPAGRTQTFLFTILGYATNFPSGGITSQGVFILEQNNVKISSAYTTKIGAAGGLNDLPVPVTFLKSVTLTAGTYTFKVRYSAWAGTAKVNVNPTTYTGYDGDTESMLTKMQILVYNN